MRKIACFDRGNVGEIPGQSFGFFGSAVGDEQGRRRLGEQGSDSAARSAASAEQKDATIVQREAEIVVDIAEQTGAIRVVAKNLPAVEGQRIHGAGSSCPFAELGAQAKSLFLERDGDIRAPASLRNKLRYGLPESINGREACLVGHCLPRVPGKGGVDGRRSGMANRISEYAIKIGHLAES